MGLLPNQYFRPDHGNSGFGFNGFYDAMSVVDQENPCIGDTFKISGKIYQLRKIFGKLHFKEIEK